MKIPKEMKSMSKSYLRTLEKINCFKLLRKNIRVYYFYNFVCVCVCFKYMYIRIFCVKKATFKKPASKI